VVLVVVESEDVMDKDYINQVIEILKDAKCKLDELNSIERTDVFAIDFSFGVSEYSLVIEGYKRNKFDNLLVVDDGIVTEKFENSYLNNLVK
jgi:regulatory protein YycH of two-component signal transduction system YycFG